MKKNKKDAMVFQPMSTGITYQLIPKATADGVTVYSTGYGRTSAANGKVFKWVFNAPVTYWDGASIAVKHILSKNSDNIKDKKIALVYHNSAYGKEPIRTLEVLAKKHGYKLMLLPVDHPGQEQKATWLKIRKARPDYILMWGWGVMNSVAVKSAASIKFPMENFIGIWWSGSENDVLPAGMGAHGYKSLTFNAPGTNYQVHRDIKKYVHDKGEASGNGSHFGEVLYNRGLFQAMVQVEAAAVAQKIHGTSKITAAMYRDGMENVKLDAKRMEELGFKNFSPPFENSCANHGGSGLAAVQQWDAKTKTWNMITDYMGSDRAVVNKLIAEDSTKYAKEQKIALRCN
jgi:branched-chain amino acid transport system substrate-binding protein